MHMLFVQFSARWMALVTGASHATSALRAMSRNAPAAELDDEFEHPTQMPLPLPLPATHAPRAQVPEPA